MKAISGKRLCQLLEYRGWQLKRINGSHHIYTKEGVITRISVPVHSNTSLKRGLQKHLMKMAQIHDSDL